jgi:hypothetical protein
MCDRGGAIGGQGDRTDPAVALVTLGQFFTSADARRPEAARSPSESMAIFGG